jgi:hypothetical protein
MMFGTYLRIASHVALGIGLLALCSDALAQRVPRADPANPQTPRQEPPTIVGKVVAYEPDKSIVLETTNRDGVKRNEFAIVKDKTKVELPPRIKEISVGRTLAVWADKEDPKLAVRIGGSGGSPATPSTPNTRRPNNRRPATPPARAEAAPVVADRARRPAREPVPGLNPQGVAAQIDKHAHARLAAKGLAAAPISDDAEFLRRVYLDITGILPPAEKVADFLASQDPGKRARLIDELLESPRYGWHFGDLWCDRIAVKDTPIYRDPFIDWVAESLNQGRGWDEVVHEMLTAEGKFGLLTRSSRLRPEDPSGLLMVLNTEAGNPPKPNPALLAAESSRLFLGVQIQCAECHDHPFSETWKQTDFWGLAAFFGQFRAASANPGFHWQETPVANDQGVSIAIPPTSLRNIGKIVPARLLGGTSDFKSQSSDSGEPQLLRHALARWMTAADNPYFARATVNRLWADFFGRGLVMPIDDLRPDNPPSHPEILELLTDELTRSHFDLKHLIRCLCLSQAYQRTSVPPAESAEDEGQLSHMAVKVLSPGVFYDCLTAATGYSELKLGLPERKTKLTVDTTFTPREVFVDFFRSSQGEEPNPLENTHGIPQALKLMNAAQLNSVPPTVQRLAESEPNREKAIEQLYLAALARRPTVAEAQLLSEFLDQRQHASTEQGYSAVLWMLINSAEFVSNH